MVWATDLLSDVRRDEDGQTLVEYSLILVLISIISIAIMTTVGLDIQGVFTDVSGALT